MTRAELQLLIDKGGEVLLPVGGTIQIDQPLLLRNNVQIRGQGTTLVSPNRGYVFDTDPRETQARWSLRGVTLRGGGLRFAPRTPEAVQSTEFFAVEDVWIWDAPIALDNQYSGAWEGAFKRIWANGCGAGFVVAGGTTLTFENCFAPYTTGPAYDFLGVYCATLTSCAFDRCQPGARAAAQFRACRGLTVNSLYAELNALTGGPLLYAESCDGLVINGLYTLGNRLAPAAGAGVHLLQLANCTGALHGVSVGGRPRANPDEAGGDPTGWTAACILVGQNHLDLRGCTIAPLDRGEAVHGQTAFSLVDQTTAPGLVSVAGQILPSLPPS